MGMALLLLGGAAACTTTADQPPRRTAEGQAALTRLLAGKAAARPVSCMQHYHFNDMTVIDGRTVVFHSAGTAYLVQLSPGCESLANGGYALLTNESGGTGLCRGQIAHVLETSSRFTAGSCGIDQIVPYTARRR